MNPKKNDLNYRAKHDYYVNEVLKKETKDLFFLDESGVHRGLTRNYGRAKKGIRVYETFDDSPKDKLNIISVIGLSGVFASYEFKGSMKKEDFRIYCLEILLKELKPNSTLILDNLSIRKDIEDIFKGKNIDILYLPPYTPEYNPIEMMWTKIKHFLKKNRSKNLLQLKQNITEVYKTITIQDIKGWFYHCAYQY